MQGGAFLRFMLIMGLGLLAYQFFSKPEEAQAPAGAASQAEQPIVPEQRQAYQYCDLWTEHFHATLTSRGATLKHFKLLPTKYTAPDEDSGDRQPIDLSTTPHPGIAVGDPDAENPNKPGLHEFRQQLFVQFATSRGPEDTGVPWNVKYDSVDWEITEQDSKTCTFVYRDADVELTKIVATTERPYELEVESSIKNLASEPRRHETSIDTVAWRLDSEVEGKMFRVSPYITHVECKPEGAEQDAVRLTPQQFDPEDLEEGEFVGGFYEPQGTPAFVAVSNAYFSHAIAPMESPAAPTCALQIQKLGTGKPGGGAFYRSRLAYPEKLLNTGESATYKALTYIGPKERTILAKAAGGDHELSELIDLGFFAAIAKILVGFLLYVHGVIPNWGLAIIILTITARLLLFPLMWPGIRNMIKMRELRPELERLTEQYKDDPRAKGMAQMDLYRKNNVNLAMGCLPTLLTMPVWFALYTTLQTAVELYNIPFLWFPDLSERDPLFILPFVIGATFFVQQKITPMQGGDPAQQKMMLYFMPGMFTVFMLFLPAGLGVYMFTNSLLGIVQQQSVEWHARRTAGTQSKAKQADDSEGSSSTKPKRKGAHRRKGKASPANS